MTDQSKRRTQSRENRFAMTGAVLLSSLAAAAVLGTALPAGLGLSFALWQALRSRQAAAIAAPARARHSRDRG